MTARLRSTLELNSSSFENGLRRSRASANTFAASMTKVSSVVKSAFIGIGAYMSTSSIVNGLERVVDSMDSVGKGARRLGISTESFSRLAYASKQSATDMDAVEKAFVKMSKAMYESSQKSPILVTTFQKIGLNLKSLNSMSPELAFIKVATAINNIPNQATRAAIAVEMFGKSGLKILDFAGQGEDALKKLFADSDKYGMTFLKSQTDAAERFDDSVKTLKGSYDGFLVSLANTGALDSASNAIKSIADNMDLVKKTAILASTAITASIFAPMIAGAATAAAGTFALQLKLASMAGIGPIAATSLLAVGAAAKTASTGVALLGGWIGVFITGATAIYIFREEIAKAATQNRVFSGMCLVVQTALAKLKMAFMDAYNAIADTWVGRKLDITPIMPDPMTALEAGKSFGEAYREGVNLAAATAGKDIGESLADKINAAAPKIKNITKVTDELTNKWAEFRQGVRDSMSSFVSDLVRGEEALSSFRSMALNVISEILTSMISGNATGIGGALAKIITSSLGGSLGIDTSGIFNTTTTSHAVGSKYIMSDTTSRLHKGEAVLRSDEVKSLSNSSGGTSINIDARGATPGVEEKIRQVVIDLKNLRDNVPTIAIKSMKNAQLRGAA